MDTTQAILILAALAQPTRLEAFRRLVACAPEGMAAGDLADHVAVPPNTLSAHLAVLSRAGLVKGLRHGRSIVYSVDLVTLRDTMLFLLKDCCNGRAEICAPLVAGLAGNCHTRESCHDGA